MQLLSTGPEIIVTCSPDCSAIVNHVLRSLEAWERWAFLSKLSACILGGVISALSVLVSSKKLPDNWHYGLSATLASSVFIMSTLQPYEEYKQFRAAYAKLASSYLLFSGSDRSKSDLNKLILDEQKAREYLKENWQVPQAAASNFKRHEF